MGAESRTGIWSGIDRALGSSPTAEPNGQGPGGLWARLRSLSDPGEFRPTLADDIEVKEFSTRWGEEYAIAANPREQLHYRLGAGEAALLRMMDGTRTVKEIVLERFQESGDLELSGVADLVLQLHEGNFLATPFTNVAGSVERAIHPVSLFQEKVAQFAKELQIEWKNADRFIRWLYHHGLKFFFHPVVVVVSLVMSLIGVVAFFANVGSHRFNLSGQSLAIGFAVLLFLQLFAVFLHELGHGAALVHYGRKVKSAGFLIFFGSPAFFIESSDGLMLERPQRLAQSAAGPYADLLVAGGVSIFVWAFPNAALSSLLYKFTVLAFLSVFMNLLPMLELDGYWLLADFLQIPELRPLSISFVRNELPRKLWKREHFTKREAGLAVYGVVGIAFTIFSFYTAYFFWQTIFGGLVKRLWSGGTTTRLILIALLLFVGGPLIRGGLKLLRSVLKRIQAFIERVRFRLQSSWRVEAAELIDALPLFDDVPQEVLSDLAGRVKLRSFAPGQAVVRQGEPADAFYAVRKGTVQVVEEDPRTGTTRLLRSLGRGEAFGELALVEGSRRSASVRSVDGSELFEVDKSTFDRLLADMIHVPEFAPSLQQIAELKALPSFAQLEPDELGDLLEHGTWMSFSPGEVLMTQGEVGDSFYAIGSGQVEIVQNGQRVETLGAGDYVGEIALLLDVPRTATVRAITPSRVYRLDREGFERLVAGSFRRGTLSPHMAVAWGT